MKNQLIILLHGLLGSMRGVAPVILLIAFFQLAVVRQPIPDLGGYWLARVDGGGADIICARA